MTCCVVVEAALRSLPQVSGTRGGGLVEEGKSSDRSGSP